MFTSSVKKDFTQSPYAETHEGEGEGQDDRGCPRNYREKFFLLPSSLSLFIVFSLFSTMHYFNTIFIFTFFFSREFQILIEASRKL